MQLIYTAIGNIKNKVSGDTQQGKVKIMVKKNENVKIDIYKRHRLSKLNKDSRPWNKKKRR